jgi:hypothetical protein
MQHDNANTILINVAFSCPCEQHEGICQAQATTPHIINTVLLYTIPSDNILDTISSVNFPLSPQDFISYQLE